MAYSIALSPRRRGSPRHGEEQSCLDCFHWRQPVTIILTIVGVLAMWRYNAALLVCGGIQQSSVIKTDLAVAPLESDVAAAPSTANIGNAAPSTDRNDMLVQQGDSVYVRGDWDGSPVVLEDYKLIFFTSAKVGCTVWKQLFRRIMGQTDWKVEATKDLLPWNPELNGLKYLYDYDRETASRMMSSPEYTRALFVREPKERLLSAYLDKGVTNSYFMAQKCCPYTYTCSEVAKSSLSNFFDVIQTCEDGHWKPQSRRMEAKYWPYINFVGRMETLADDAKTLLKSVGAWDKFGKSGWGKNGNVSVFETKAGGTGRLHATNARERLRVHYTPGMERNVEFYYSSDYANPVLNFTKTHLYTTLQR
jgi:hypothetical protein